MLNILWPIFIIISILYAIFTGNIDNINNSIFESTESAVNLTIQLIGITCLWSGLMEIITHTKLIVYLKKTLKPVIKFLFPGIDIEGKACNNIVMNMIANILGLGNASTPLGLKAMSELQKENNQKDSLSNNMVMLILINTASLQLIPMTIISIRNSFHSSNPNEIIFPVWVATICAAIAGISFTKLLIKKGK